MSRIHSLAENPKLDKGSALAKAITYSQNQEPYLRKFLENPIIPLDNNDAERSICSFCVGKHSWHAIDSKDGAWASAVWYSLAETAKANGLKTYEYFQYLLEQILQHQDKPLQTYIPALMPWSDTIPESCKKLK